MKKLILSALLIIVTVTFSSAQLTEGEVKYEINASSDDSSMDMAIMMLQGSKMAIYFSGDKARTEIDMGAMMKMTVIVNDDTENVLMLMSGIMGNTAVTTTPSELEDLNKGEEAPEMEIELVDESKNILGYSCKKAILTDEDGNEIIYWYTTEIAVNRVGQTGMNSQVPGFPLEFATNQNGLIMSFVATEFNETLSDDEETLFGTDIPDGYETKTLEDLQNMGMGM